MFGRADLTARVPDRAIASHAVAGLRCGNPETSRLSGRSLRPAPAS